MENKRVCVVTGASKGIGLETAKRFIKGGYTVYGLCRTDADGNGIKYIKCDVTDENEVRNAFASVAQKEGRIDVVIANAGCGISGAVEAAETDDVKKQFDVNFFGVFNTVKSAIPYLRESRGRILAVSSAAELFPIPFQAFYSASKAAVGNFIRAVGNEVGRFGVQTGYVLLGDVKTSFTSSRKKDIRLDSVYDGAISRGVAKMENDEQNGMSPASVAEKIYKYANKKRLPARKTVGVQYKALSLLSRLLPVRLQDRIIGSMYGGKK